jgi:chromate transporter
VRGVPDRAPHSDVAGDSPPPGEPFAESARGSLGEIARLFTLLGFTAFGGPAAHVALIEDQVVTRRRWISRQHFLDIVSAINFIPGPNSTELVMHLGYLRGGFAGLVIAGACFIAPAMLLILPIAWAYVTYGQLPSVSGMMAMISCAVVAIVAMAAWRFAVPIFKRPPMLMLAIVSAAIAIVLSRYTGVQPELVALAFAAIVSILMTESKTIGLRLPALAPFPLAAELTIPLPDSEWLRGVGSLCIFLLKVGATLFGSGYVLVSYLRSGLVVNHGWMTEPQLLDAIAVGQFTPGPLLTTATFVGYVLGHGRFGGGHLGGAIGAVAATIAIFLPSFVFVAIVGPLLQRIRHHRIARAALEGMNAAVAALLAIVCVQLGISALQNGGTIGALVLAGALIALSYKLNATWVILGAIAVGSVRQLVT